MNALPPFTDRRKSERSGQPAISEDYDPTVDGTGRVYVDMKIDGMIDETLIGHDRADAERQARSWRLWWLSEKMPAWIADRAAKSATSAANAA